MKNTKKIHILSSEEMKQEQPVTERRSQKSNCPISERCADGQQVYCSGVNCQRVEELSGGKFVLKGVICYDENGFLMSQMYCDNSGTSSESASNPYDACSGHEYGTGCQWRDETALMHNGYCTYNIHGPEPVKLYCKESGGSGSGD